MKTPRFFIALAACAVMFTIASSSIESVLRPCWAESMPVLRVDPRMGDPEDPKGPMELPSEDWGVYSTTPTLESAGITPIHQAPRRSSKIEWRQLWSTSLLRMFCGWRL